MVTYALILIIMALLGVIVLYKTTRGTKEWQCEYCGVVNVGQDFCLYCGTDKGEKEPKYYTPKVNEDEQKYQ